MSNSLDPDQAPHFAKPGLRAKSDYRSDSPLMSNSLGPDRARHIKFSSDRAKFSPEHPFFANRLSVLTHCLILRSKLMAKHDVPFRV